ncbi:caspase family protein [Sphaerotilus sp.]|uniref:caspase family protein n=1 Tax=Sphaerotilus sp. TaxID=2093942 RepID=UPI002ACD3ACD|nr:caspase family protein [Sphaerotilus sp.]MDZ7857925.1 caspase family protein [Sphaerotilus sp.]
MWADVRRVALLVGVSAYRHPAIPALDGPAHDVAAMREVLIRRWGFRAEDIRTLTDRQATRDHILSELTALAGRSGPSDEVLVYFSGHGTSALDLGAAALGVPVPHGSGAFMAHDFDLSQPTRGLIVGRTDLVPRIEALERGERRLWVVMDTCYSGQAVRQVTPTRADPDAWAERTFTISRPDIADRMARQAPGRSAPPPYPYRATAFLSAAGEGETAKDVSRAKLRQWPTLDGQPHGALTDALLRVLDGRIAGDLNGDGWLDLNEVHRAVGDFMAQRPYGHTPQRLPSVAQDTLGLGSRAVLSVKGGAARPVEAPPTPLTVRTEDLPGPLVKRLQGLPDVKLLSAGGTGADLEIVRAGDLVDVVDASGDRLVRMQPVDADRLVGLVQGRAWARRVKALAERHRRGVLPVGIEPAGFGGDFTEGQELNFSVRPDRELFLLMVNVNAMGEATLMYPTEEYERKSSPGRQLVQVPSASSRLTVRLPEGKDIQLFFGFDQEPSRELTRVDALARLVQQRAGQFSFGHSEFRTWRRRQQ